MTCVVDEASTPRSSAGQGCGEGAPAEHRGWFAHACGFSQQPAAWLGLGAVLALAGGRRGRAAALRGLAGYGTAATLANFVLKPLIHRQRPAGSAKGRGPVTSSFPSGHSATEVAFALTSAQQIPQLLVPLLGFSLAGKVSLVRTRAHFLGDVAAGSVIAVGISGLLWWLWPPRGMPGEARPPARGPREFLERLNEYRLTSCWRVPVPPEQVYPVLEDVGGYPDWWPDIRSATVHDSGDVSVVIRSVLPYSLRLRLRPQADRPESPRLKAQLRGDLEGWSRWTVEPESSGGAHRNGSGHSNGAPHDGNAKNSVLCFEEQVALRRPLLRLFAPVARGPFRLNHALMMRRGERGLRRVLAGQR